MYIFKSYITRLYRDKGFLLVIISLFLLIQLAFIYSDSSSISFLNSKISILNKDKSEASIEFIKKIESSNFLKVYKETDKDKKTLLDKNIIDFHLEIPKNFFKNFPDEKIIFTSNANDFTSPAIIDVLTSYFIVEASKNILINQVSSELGDEYIDYAIGLFDKNKSNKDFKLDIKSSYVNKSSTLSGEASLKNIRNQKQSLLYILNFISLFLVISLTLKTDEKISKRLVSREKFFIKYYIVKNLVNIFILLVPTIYLVLGVFSRLEINTENLLKFLISPLILIIFVYEMTLFIFSIFKNKSSSLVFSFLILILMQILGSSYFDIDLSFKQNFKILKLTPFNMVSENYDSLVFDSRISYFYIGVFLVLLLVLVFINFLFQKSQSKKPRL